MTTKQLSKLLSSSEDRANRRMVAAAAFLVKAQGEGEAEAVAVELKSLAEQSTSFVQQDAALARSLLTASADGLAFLQLLVP